MPEMEVHHTAQGTSTPSRVPLPPACTASDSLSTLMDVSGKPHPISTTRFTILATLSALIGQTRAFLESYSCSKTQIPVSPPILSRGSCCHTPDASDALALNGHKLTRYGSLGSNDPASATRATYIAAGAVPSDARLDDKDTPLPRHEEDQPRPRNHQQRQTTEDQRHTPGRPVGRSGHADARRQRQPQPCRFYGTRNGKFTLL